jgi:CRP-like cAMP-binding protein
MNGDDSFLFVKLTSFMPLTKRERSTLAELLSPPVAIGRGQELLHQGDKGHVGYVMRSGWGCSFKVLHDGSRQVITFPVQGDCVGLRSALLKTSDHAFCCLTDAYVSKIEVDRLLKALNEYPRLGVAILWSLSRDEAITVDHLTRLGRRTALERTAHFFLELAERLRLVGLLSKNEFDCPLSQNDLADALGLTAIHVNRVLRQLRELDLMKFKDHVVKIIDPREMKVLAGYEDID